MTPRFLSCMTENNGEKGRNKRGNRDGFGHAVGEGKARIWSVHWD